MGVQATMTIGDKKGSTAAIVNQFLAAFPLANQVRIVTFVTSGNDHQFADIQRAIRNLIDYARDNNLFTSAVSIAVITSVGGLKKDITTNTLASTVGNNDIALMINGTERAKGSRNIMEEAHLQLLDWMNENDRLVT